MLIIFIAAAALALKTSPQAAPAKPAPPGGGGEQTRCKRYTEIGSLAKVTRVCHTVAEWDRLQQQGRADSEAYQQAGAPPRHD